VKETNVAQPWADLGPSLRDYSYALQRRTETCRPAAGIAPIAALIGLSWAALLPSAAVAAEPVDNALAREVLTTLEVAGGLIVHVGSGDPIAWGKLTAALGADSRFVVHGLYVYMCTQDGRIHCLAGVDQDGAEPLSTVSSDPYDGPPRPSK
jgi:hypothetical protein